MQAGSNGREAGRSQHGSSRTKQGAPQHDQTVPFPVLLSRTAYQMLVEQVRLTAPPFSVLQPCAWQACMSTCLSQGSEYQSSCLSHLMSPHAMTWKTAMHSCTALRGFQVTMIMGCGHLAVMC